MIYEKMICIEGLNGSGKATQTSLLLGYLRKKYGDAKTIEFPVYDSPSGQLLKSYLEEGLNKENTLFNALLYELNRFEFLPLMEKWIKQGKWIVLDRYIYSNWTFQAVLARYNNFLEWIKAVENPLPKPKYKIFLDVPVEITIELMKNKKKDWHESDVEFIKEVKKKYDEIVKDGWIVIDCMENGVIRSKEDIHREIVRRLGI